MGTRATSERNELVLARNSNGSGKGLRRDKVESNKGFTLIELLVVIAIIALLIGILLPGLAESRRLAKVIICKTNMRTMAQGVNNYASEYQDKIATFSWTRNKWNPSVTAPAGLADLRGPYSDDLRGASAQAVAIMRTRGDAPDMPFIPLWQPFVLYNHLVLQEYLDLPLPSKYVVCPDDKNRLRWQNKADFRAGRAGPQPDPSDPNNWRWSYSSSYQYTPSTYSPDRGDAPRFNTIIQAGLHFQYQFSNAAAGDGQNNVLGRRRFGDVAFPQQKVLLIDQAARHFGKRDWYYAYPQAKLPIAFYDGHVRLIETGTPTQITAGRARGAVANPGYQPANPRGNGVTTFQYQPNFWEAPLRNGTRVGSETVIGYYNWTRGGMQGVDVNGDEINTANW